MQGRLPNIGCARGKAFGNRTILRQMGWLWSSLDNNYGLDKPSKSKYKRVLTHAPCTHLDGSCDFP